MCRGCVQEVKATPNRRARGTSDWLNAPRRLPVAASAPEHSLTIRATIRVVADTRPDEHTRAATKELTRLLPIWSFVAPYRWRAVGAFVALLVTASVTLSVGQGLRLLVDRGLAQDSVDVLQASILVFAVLVLVLTAGTWIRFYLVSWVGERVSADIRTAVYARLVRLHPGFFDTNRPTEISSRITTDTTLVQTVIGSSVSIALRNLLMGVGGVCLLVVTNPRLSLLVLACVPLVVLPVAFFGRRVRRLSRSSQDRIADVGSYAGESLRHIRVVQAFRREGRDLDAFRRHVNRAFEVAVQRIRQRAWLVATVMVLVLAAVATMLWIGGQDVLSGRTTQGELVAFIFYAFVVAGSVGALSEVWGEIQRAAGAAERLLELLASSSRLPEPNTSTAQTTPGRIEFRRVSFRYPSRPSANVLDDVSFAVEPGEMVALVGPSGAGKSTMLELVLRFHDVDEGMVLVGGVDVRAQSLSDLRRQMAPVPQDAVLFAGSIANNLAYGAAESKPADIEAALEDAHAADFVAALPDGIETNVGEGGVGLSGGQRQRLAIARAFLAAPALPGRPGILLVDEATSALDARSEEAIRTALELQKGKRTVLIVAHRLSTVRQADRIIVLDEGRTVASGTHSALVATNALYREFALAQFLEPDVRDSAA